MSKKKSGPGRDKETEWREVLRGAGWGRGNENSKGMRCGERTQDANCRLGAFATYMTIQMSQLKGNLRALGHWPRSRRGKPEARCSSPSPRELRPRPEALPSPVHRRLVVRVESPGESARRHLEVHGVG